MTVLNKSEQLYNLAIFKGGFENRRFSFNNLAWSKHIRSVFFLYWLGLVGYVNVIGCMLKKRENAVFTYRGMITWTLPLHGFYLHSLKNRVHRQPG